MDRFVVLLVISLIILIIIFIGVYVFVRALVLFRVECLENNTKTWNSFKGFIIDNVKNDVDFSLYDENSDYILVDGNLYHNKRKQTIDKFYPVFVDSLKDNYFLVINIGKCAPAKGRYSKCDF